MTQQKDKPTFSVGKSLYLGVQALGEDGSELSLTGITVTAEARAENGRRKDVMVVEWIDRALGRFEVWASGDGTCTGWLPGDYLVTVTYSEPGAGTGGRTLVSGTEQVVIQVVE